MNKIKLRKNIEKELIKRFDDAFGEEITITMKCDGRELILEPQYLAKDKLNPDINRSMGFSVYTILEKGKAALPHMCAPDLSSLAGHIMSYKGLPIDKLEDDNTFDYYVKMMPTDEEIGEENLAFESKEVARMMANAYYERMCG